MNELVFNMENDETSVIRSAKAKITAKVLIFLAADEVQCYYRCVMVCKVGHS